MARKTEGPWYREARNAWYVWHEGKQLPLGKHPADAPPARKRKGKWVAPEGILKAYHALMAAGGRDDTPQPTRRAASETLVAEIFDEFLGWVKDNKEKGTFDSYLRRLGSFLKYLKRERLLGTLTVSQLRPFHVERWVAEHPKWNPGMRRGQMTAVQRAMNWAVRSGRIPESPVRFLEKPPQGRRENVITPALYEWMRGLVKSPAFLDLITVAWEVGCRPQEIMRVEARHVDLAGERWVFPEKESKGKKRKRIVYLTPVALEVTRRLMARWPEGKLFRNSEAQPWKPFAVSSAFCRLQYQMARQRMKAEKIPGSRAKDKHKRYAENRKLAGTLVTKYALVDFRHSYVTRAIKNGVDPVTLANLVGHVDTSMLSKVYAHLAQDTEHLKKALGKISPG